MDELERLRARLAWLERHVVVAFDTDIPGDELERVFMFAHIDPPLVGESFSAALDAALAAEATHPPRRVFGPACLSPVATSLTAASITRSGDL